MTTAERNKLNKLQQKYNKLHERIGYTEDEATIAAINYELDRICEKMNAILEKGGLNHELEHRKNTAR